MRAGRGDVWYFWPVLLITVGGKGWTFEVAWLNLWCEFLYVEM